MAAPTETGTEVFYVRVLLTGPPDQLRRATRYAKENVGRATDSLQRTLGVASSVSVYSQEDPGDQVNLREQTVEFGDTGDDPPPFLDIEELDAA